MSLPLFIAAGYSGARIVSDNGKDWRDLVLGRDGQVYRSIAFGNGRFLASATVGGPSVHAVTTDGVLWRSLYTPQPNDNGNGLKGNGFGMGKFIAFGGDTGGGGLGAKNHVFTSSDGLKWDPPTYPKSERLLRRVAFGDGKFVGVGDAGRRTVSKDGVNWEDAANPLSKYTLVDIAFGKGLFVGVGLHSLRMTTTDGVNWSKPMIGEEGEHLNSVVFCGDRFVAAGPDVTYSSPDGANWTRSANENGPLTMTWGGGVFIGTRWKGRLFYSHDAIKWTQTYAGDYHFETVGSSAGAAS